jgi:hypothetical protein
VAHRQDYRVFFSKQPTKVGKGSVMVKNFDDIQHFGKDGVEATLKSFGAVSKAMQAIGVEIADYSKRAFEEGAAATEKLIGAKSLDRAFEVQSDYVRAAYEGFIAEAAKLGELYADLAQESYKPFEGLTRTATVK